MDDSPIPRCKFRNSLIVLVLCAVLLCGIILSCKQFDTYSHTSIDSGDIVSDSAKKNVKINSIGIAYSDGSIGSGCCCCAFFDFFEHKSNTKENRLRYNNSYNAKYLNC